LGSTVRPGSSRAVMSLEAAARRLALFERGTLTSRLAALEEGFKSATSVTAAKLCESETLDGPLLEAALVLKRVAGQINVTIHAVGILLSLPLILEQGEVIQSLSLGAGNTGRDFDLVTNRRLAEFKFIRWQGGPESIRQNTLFKDFFELVEAPSSKAKSLFVLGLEHPLRFLNGGRALKSVLSRHVELESRFRAKYGDRFKVVRDYYSAMRHSVEIIDLLPIIPALASLPGDA